MGVACQAPGADADVGACGECWPIEWADGCDTEIRPHGLAASRVCGHTVYVDVWKTILRQAVRYRRASDMMEIPLSPVVQRVDPVDVEEHLQQRRHRRRQSVVRCCRRTVAFIFSHVGLATMVVAYSVAGGFLFRTLEAPYEKQRRAEYGGMKEVKVGEVKRLVDQQFDRIPLLQLQKRDELFAAKLLAIFAKFEEEVTRAVRDGGWDGKDKNTDSDLQWSFPGALLYAVSVITTIGYGHVTPKTEVGQIVTMCYALIGIPLTFLCLSNIGNILADGFRLFYCRVLCDICCCRRCQRQRRLQRLGELRQQSQTQGQIEDQQQETKKPAPESGQGSNVGGDVRVQFLLASSCSNVANDDNVECCSISAQNDPQRRLTDNFAFEPDDKMDLRSVASGLDTVSDRSSLLRSASISASISKSSTRFRRFACVTPQNPTATNHNRNRNLKISCSTPQCDQLLIPSISSRTLLTPLDQPFDSNLNATSRTGCCVGDPSRGGTGSRRRTRKDQPEGADDQAERVSRRNSFRQLANSVTDLEVRETDILSDDDVNDDNDDDNDDDDDNDENDDDDDNDDDNDDNDDDDENGVGCSSEDDDDGQRSEKSCSDIASVRSDSICGSDDKLSVSVLERIADLPETEIVANLSDDERKDSRSSTTTDQDDQLTPRVNGQSATCANRKRLSDRTAAIAGAITRTSGDASVFTYPERVTVAPEVRAERDLNKVGVGTTEQKRNQQFEQTKRSLRSSSELKLAETTRFAGSSSLYESVSKTAKTRTVWSSRMSNLTSRKPRNVTRSSASLAVGRRLSSTDQPEIETPCPRQRFSSHRQRAFDRPSSVACDGACELPSSAPTSGTAEAERCLTDSASKFDYFRSPSTPGQNLSSVTTLVRDPDVEHRGRFHNRRHIGSQKLVRQSYFTPSTSQILRSNRPPWSLRLKCKRRPRLPISCPTSPNSTVESANVSLSSTRRFGTRRRPLTDATAMAKSAGELNHYTSPQNSSKSVAIVDAAVSNECQETEGDLDDGQDFNGIENNHSGETNYFICNVSELDDIECKARNGSTGAEKVTVPVFICLIIIVGYICCGALLFTLWEEWDFLKASYFCFITLSTIGFGDIVPGTEENQWASHEKLVLCALWLAFGLSLLAMCFNLMQEEVRETFRLAGLKVGLIREELLDSAVMAE